LRTKAGGFARIAEIPYIAGDVETTGLSAVDGHRVCEVALLRFLRGTVIDSFVSLVNLCVPSTRRFRRERDHRRDGRPRPTFADLLPRILDFLEDDPLVFHNAPFDLSFLRSEARLAGARGPGTASSTRCTWPAGPAASAPTPAAHLQGTRDRLHLPPGGSRRLGRGETVAAPRPAGRESLTGRPDGLLLPRDLPLLRHPGGVHGLPVRLPHRLHHLPRRS